MLPYLRLLLVAFTLYLPLTAAAYDLVQLKKLQQHNTAISAMVVDLDSHNILAQINPKQTLRPASISKLFAAADALIEFGPDYQFSTQLAYTGVIKGGHLQGDLVLVGGGDPTFDDQQLQTLVNQLHIAGITHIDGDVIINTSLFGTWQCEIKDRCQAHRHSKNAYDAPLSAAGINFGTLEISIFPSLDSKATPQILLSPVTAPNTIIHNELTPTGHAAIQIRRLTDSNQTTIQITGSQPLEPYVRFRAVAKASQLTARTLKNQLQQANITLSGRLKISAKPGQDWHPLAEVKSDMLRYILGPMLDYSNNYTADMLTLGIAAKHNATTPISLGQAASHLEQLNRKAMAAAAWAPQGAAEAVFKSGSGLSLKNSLSAEHMVALLNYMYQKPGLFPSFYGAIPVPKYAASNALKFGSHAWQTRVVAKTGTLSKPVAVHSVAGYMRLKNGDLAAFAVVINGLNGQRQPTRTQAIRAYQRDLDNLLHSHERKNSNQLLVDGN